MVHDVNEASVKKLKEQGAKVAKNPKELASQVDSIITMLPSSPHVQQVYGADNGLLAGLGKNTLLIDTSTIDPTIAREVNGRVVLAGGEMLDAPVSGGTKGATEGTLTFMVGGDRNTFERARPILSSMGKNIVYCGGVGNGQVAKICNNLVLAISMIGVSEAMNLGIRLGMDAKVLAGIFNTSSARCWSSDTYNPVPGVMENVPASRGYTGGFAADLMAKDLSLVLMAASSSKIPVPLGGTASQIYNLLSTHGFGGKDFSSVYEFLQKKN